MLKHKTQVEEISELTLEGELTIFRAAELKPVLLGNPRPLAIHLSGVTEIDTAGVQLLMQAKKMALQSQARLSLVACSPAVLDVLDIFNLLTYFEVSLAGGKHES
jgi:anti-anti-sigma factor